MIVNFCLQTALLYPLSHSYKLHPNDVFTLFEYSMHPNYCSHFLNDGRSSRLSKIPSLPKTPLLKPPLMQRWTGATSPCQKLATGVAASRRTWRGSGRPNGAMVVVMIGEAATLQCMNKV